MGHNLTEPAEAIIRLLGLGSKLATCHARSRLLVIGCWPHMLNKDLTRFSSTPKERLCWHPWQGGTEVTESPCLPRLESLPYRYRRHYPLYVLFPFFIFLFQHSCFLNFKTIFSDCLSALGSVEKIATLLSKSEVKGKILFEKIKGPACPTSVLHKRHKFKQKPRCL